MNSPQVNWTLVKAGDGNSWRGVVTLPAQPAGADGPQQALKITGKKARSKDEALRNVANTAQLALDNPIIQSVLPPGVGPVLKALATPKVAKAVVRHGKKALRVVKGFFK